MRALKVDAFKLHSPDCSALVNGTVDLSATTSQPEPNTFESRLAESIVETPLIQFYPNSTFHLEYYLKVMVFGRDGNDLPLTSDESPVLTELAMIDNSAFNIIPNISLKAPRRFFRIGVAHVRLAALLYIRTFIFLLQNDNVFSWIFEMFVLGNSMVVYKNESKNINTNFR